MSGIPSEQVAVRVHKFSVHNVTETVSADRVPVPEPGQGELLLKINLRPVNPADTFSLMGVYPGFQPKDLPAVPGLEGMGEVAKLGEGASKFTVGQRVALGDPTQPRKGNGTWQQYMVVPEAGVTAVPDLVSDESAAQFVINPLTAYGMLKSLNAPKGAWILQNAANSALGRMIIQLAKHWGYRTINVVRRREVVEELLQLGGDAVICTADEDIKARVMDITGGEGAFGALDAVLGEASDQLLQSLQDSGTLILYGALSGMTSQVGFSHPVFRDVTVRGFWMATYLKKASPEEREKILNEVMDLIKQKVINPAEYLSSRHPLEDVKNALMEANKDAKSGKVLLVG